MNPPLEYSFPRYLASKKSVDDRALNRHVWQTLASQLQGSSSEPSLHVLEVGAGIGTMIERVLEWGLLPAAAAYTALDVRPENIQQATERLPVWGRAHGWRVEPCPPAGMLFERRGQRLTVEMEAIDLFDFIAREAGSPRWDLLIAHAFLDLMDIPSALPQLFRLLRPGGLFYFSLNF
ncbi:MAG TPA: class I SAM-dependent methyltransferase, partial [Anaerolineales bacterium]